MISQITTLHQWGKYHIMRKKVISTTDFVSLFSYFIHTDFKNIYKAVVKYSLQMFNVFGHYSNDYK